MNGKKRADAKKVKVTKKGLKRKNSVALKKSLKKRKPVVRKISYRSKKKSPNRLPTLIKNFDRLIEGGFEQGSTNLLIGSSGSGKTIFAMQFLMGGLLKGEKCLYVTFEEKKDSFYSNMKDFGWDLESYEKKGLFTFLEYTPTKVKTMLDEGGGAIENLIVGKKISRMVIDSMTSFELLFEDEVSRRAAGLSLFSLIRGWDCTSLLTLDLDVDAGKFPSRLIEFEVDSIIALHFIRQRGEHRRYLEIMKMRGTKHADKVYQFVFGGKGIELNKSPAKQSF